MVGHGIGGTKGAGRRDSGQAAVEAALTLPLTVFLILGTLQFFMILQARIMAEYAAFRAVRAGSVNYGDCEVMNHAAIASLLPTFARTNTPGRIGSEFNKFRDNDYGNQVQIEGTALNNEVVWIFRERPLAGAVNALPDPQDVDFDEFLNPNPLAPGGNGPTTLEARLVFWYPLKMPFANWVISRMLLAHYNLQPYNAANPLLLAEAKAGWPEGATSTLGDAQVAARYKTLVISGRYVFPIQATYSMRMMTPVKKSKFGSQNCF